MNVYVTAAVVFNMNLTSELFNMFNRTIFDILFALINCCNCKCQRIYACSGESVKMIPDLRCDQLRPPAYETYAPPE